MAHPSSSGEGRGMLLPTLTGDWREAGCDEAGRGCLAGPVTAAAVILPEGFVLPGLDDSKRLAATERFRLRDLIIENSHRWAVAEIDHRTIDDVNILRASILAMHKALAGLGTAPVHIIVDGIHFDAFRDLPHTCVPKADGLYMHVAAASVLAKTFRDERMAALHREYPVYGWNTNKGYPTPAHRTAIAIHGLSPYHRRSFRQGQQLRIELG